MTKEYHVSIKQNGGEYIGWISINCENLDQVDKRTVKADTVTIEFDEDIIEIN